MLHTRSMFLESLWWFLHRTTGFNCDMEEECAAEFAALLGLTARQQSSKNQQLQQVEANVSALQSVLNCEDCPRNAVRSCEIACFLPRS